MSADGPPLHVLVAEDEPTVAELHARLLEAWGYEARVAQDPLADALAFRPDVVLLDIHMPTVDGITLARRLRQQRGPGRPLLVAVTGDHDFEIQRRARQAGVDHYLLKPIDPAELKRLLRRQVFVKWRRLGAHGVPGAERGEEEGGPTEPLSLEG